MTAPLPCPPSRPRAPKRVRLALMALACSTAPVLAQESTVQLDTVVVRGSTTEDDQTIVARESSAGSKLTQDVLDSAASVSVVTEAEIDRRKPQNLEQVLSYSAGVVTNEWGSDDRYDFVRVRGFSTLETGTYRDGLPERGFGWTFGRVEPYGLSRVEVLKGSNSALYGLSGPGGLVNNVTKKPTGGSFAETYTTLGQDHVELGADFGGANADGSLSYRVTAKWQDGEYDYDYSRDDRRYLAFAVTWAPDDLSSLTILADYNQRKGVPGNGYPVGVSVDVEDFFGEPDFNRFDTTQRSIGWQYSRDLGNGLSFHQNARYSKLDLTYQQVYGATTDATADRSSFQVDSDMTQFVVDTQLQYDASFGDWDSRTLVGMEYGRIKVNEVAQYGTAGALDITDISYCGLDCITLGDYISWHPEETRKSLYLQEELTFDDRWILTLGGRYDHARVAIDYDSADYRYATYGSSEARTFIGLTGRAGLTYKASENLSFYGNYSESFEPNVWDLSEDEKKGKQYELGVKYRPEGMNALVTAAVFDLTQTNVDVQTSPTEYHQIGKIGVRGLELEGKGQIADRLNLIASYSYWDAEIREDGIQGNAGNRPSNVPKHMASLWLDYTIPGAGGRGDLTLSGGLRYVGNVYADDANTVRVGGRTVFDAAVSYGVARNVDLALNVSNLFDKEYATTIYGNDAWLGEGREVSATLKYKW
ncbi:MAG: TonB-dependent siderophore receptor [Paracoccus sp. (in: a-proteobacteria)]|uniref:TonB-dependent siderophore receptor n=1 Tax=Paracoccus sp. TaxID=267 RepID=UPI0039E4B0E2